MEVWGLIQGLGALVGLATGGFVLWDRMVRTAPLMVIRAQPLIQGGANFVPFLEISNRADRPIIVKWKNGELENSFGLARDSSLRAAIESIIEGETVLAIDKNECRSIQMHLPSNLRGINIDNQIDVSIRWTFAQPVFLKVDRTRRVKITKRNLHALLPDDYRFFDDGLDNTYGTDSLEESFTDSWKTEPSKK